MLEGFQRRLLERARAIRESFLVEVTTRAELLDAFAGGKASLAHGPWCGDAECELEVKNASQGATIRVIDEGTTAAGPCAACGKEARHTVYWARAY